MSPRPTLLVELEEFMIRMILMELEYPIYDLNCSDCHEILGAIGRTQDPSI